MNYIMRTFFTSTLIVFLLLSMPAKSVAVSRSIVPFEPPVIAVPVGLSTDMVIQSMAEAFVIRTWIVTDIDFERGFVDGELPIRSHVARVRAHVGPSEITFTYRESENVDHGFVSESYDGRRKEFSTTRQSEDDVESVHRNFLVWLDEVARTADGLLLLMKVRQSRHNN